MTETAQATERGTPRTIYAIVDRYGEGYVLAKALPQLRPAGPQRPTGLVITHDAGELTYDECDFDGLQGLVVFEGRLYRREEFPANDGDDPVDPDEGGWPGGDYDEWSEGTWRPMRVDEAVALGLLVLPAGGDVAAVVAELERATAQKYDAMSPAVACEGNRMAAVARARVLDLFAAERLAHEAAIREMAKARRLQADAESARDVEAAVRYSIVGDVAEAIGLTGDDLEDALNHPVKNLLPEVSALYADRATERARAEKAERERDDLRERLNKAAWWARRRSGEGEPSEDELRARGVAFGDYEAGFLRASDVIAQHLEGQCSPS